MATPLNNWRLIHEIDADPDMPPPWAVPDLMKLPLIMFACGRALCGACARIRTAVKVAQVMWGGAA